MVRHTMSCQTFSQFGHRYPHHHHQTFGDPATPTRNTTVLFIHTVLHSILRLAYISEHLVLKSSESSKIGFWRGHSRAMCPSHTVVALKERCALNDRFRRASLCWFRTFDQLSADGAFLCPVEVLSAIDCNAPHVCFNYESAPLHGNMLFTKFTVKSAYSGHGHLDYSVQIHRSIIEILSRIITLLTQSHPRIIFTIVQISLASVKMLERSAKDLARSNDLMNAPSPPSVRVYSQLFPFGNDLPVDFIYSLLYLFPDITDESVCCHMNSKSDLSTLMGGIGTRHTGYLLDILDILMCVGYNAINVSRDFTSLQ
ncbi:hypothetical protein Tco_0576864 [Tanacetum coccineum]